MEILPGLKPVPKSAEEAKILLLETSGSHGIVALGDGKVIRCHRILEIAKKHVSDMAPAILGMLNECDWVAGDLDAIATGTGPGSYTGLRIALMSARTLAMVTGARLLGIPTFEIIAQDCIETGHEKVEVIADAQQDKIYSQCFQSKNGKPMTCGELAIVGISDWINQRDHGFTMAGPGIPKVSALLSEIQGVVISESPFINNKSFLALAWDKLMRNDSDDPMSLQPLYMRRSSAEEQWDKKLKTKATGEEGKP